MVSGEYHYLKSHYFPFLKLFYLIIDDKQTIIDVYPMAVEKTNEQKRNKAYFPKKFVVKIYFLFRDLNVNEIFFKI